MSARAWLRGATRDSHAGVDALFGAGLADRATYAGYLAGMHAFLAPVADALPGLDRSIHCLEADLATIGAAPPPHAPCIALAGDDILGWRYVIDGSALGARVLLRQVAALGHDGHRGGRFLSRHAEGTGWTATLAALEDFPADASRRRALADAASCAFAAARAAFVTALAVAHRRVAA